jgi:predicted XRE-type DNA-binding protein
MAHDNARCEAIEREFRTGRAHLALQIQRTITLHGHTQASVAELRGTDQAKVSLLRRERGRGFSLERLIRFLCLLRYDVTIVVRRGRGGLFGTGRFRADFGGNWRFQVPRRSSRSGGFSMRSPGSGEKWQ